MLWNIENNLQRIRNRSDYINTADLIGLQDQLNRLERESGVIPKRSRLFRGIDRLVEKQTVREVDRKRYIKLALFCGWFTGGHRLYAGQQITGLLYLLFCWTGIPLAMTVLDLMAVIPMTTDEQGKILI